MKPAHTPPAPSYRNDRIFRSAQRLIATRPVPKRSPRRWKKFAAAAIALLLSIVVVREIDLRWFQRASAETNPVDTTSRSRLSAPSPVRPLSIQDWSTPAVAPPNLPVTTEHANPPDRHAGPKTTSTAVEQNSSSPARDLDTWLTKTTDGVTLRGTLHAESIVPIPVEIFLRRKDRQVSGVVRYLSFLGERVLANAVSGEINGRSLTLKETGRVWSFPRNPENLVQPPEEIGREFAITLPTSSGPQTLAGTWSISRQQGTLQLSPAPRW